MTAESASWSGFSFPLTPAWPGTNMKVSRWICDMCKDLWHAQGSVTCAEIQAIDVLESQPKFSLAYLSSRLRYILARSFVTWANSELLSLFSLWSCSFVWNSQIHFSTKSTCTSLTSNALFLLNYPTPVVFLFFSVTSFIYTEHHFKLLSLRPRKHQIDRVQAGSSKCF